MDFFYNPLEPFFENFVEADASFLKGDQMRRNDKRFYSKDYQKQFETLAKKKI